MNVFIGFIAWFGFNYAPREWAYCSGQIEQISNNSALYALIGARFGGDGRMTFALPDLRSRIPVGSITMGTPPPPLDPIDWAERGGNQTIVLSISHLPPHNHAATFTPGGGGSAVVGSLKVSSQGATKHAASSGDSIAAPAGALGDALNGYNDKAPDVEVAGLTISGGGSGGGTVTVGDTGVGDSFPVLNPYLGLTACIALDGTFPARN
ncbi:MAG: tail fiber protein [Bacteroidota bacterium]